MALIAAGVVWLVIGLSDDGEPTGSESRFQTTPPPAAQALTNGPNWQLVVTPDRGLSLIRNSGAIASVRGYTDPVTLNEATSFLVPERQSAATIVAGPINERAARLTVQTSRGATMDATLVAAQDLTWFWAEFPARIAVSAIEARDENGSIVDEYALPGTMPPPDPIVVGRMEGAR